MIIMFCDLIAEDVTYHYGVFGVFEGVMQNQMLDCLMLIIQSENSSVKGRTENNFSFD